MRNKVKLLLVRRDGVRDPDIESVLSQLCDEIAQRASGPVDVMRAYAINDKNLYRIAAGAFAAAERPFDTLVEVSSSMVTLTELVALFDGVADRLDGLIDVTVSAALAGTEHVILPGAGPFIVHIANRRLAHFTHDDFIRYWVEYHGPFAREHTPKEVNLYYNQFHTDEGSTATLLARSGFSVGDFDGAAECAYPSADYLRQLMAMADIVDEATVDEKQFVDHDRCVTSVLARFTPL